MPRAARARAGAALPLTFGIALLGLAALPARAAETRCGWFSNPTPANAWLTDRDGEWTVAVQGGHQAEGDWPEFGDANWVRFGPGSYGYGCACMSVETDGDRRVTNILSAKARPLSACRKDPALKGVERKMQ